MGEWKEIQLGKLGKTYTGLSGKTKDDFGFGKPYIPYLNVFQNNKIKPSQLDFVNIKYDEKQNQVKYGDLFFTTSSETIEEVGMTSVLLHDLGEVYLNSFCFGFRLNDFEDLLPEYVPYLFRSDEIRHKISLQGQGSTRFNLSKTELLKKLILNLPSKPEQTRIAEILSTADEAIAHTEALIAKYQRIKTGLMQDLLTKGIDENGNIRSKATHKFVVKNGIEVPEEWEVPMLKELLAKPLTYGIVQPGNHDPEGIYMIRSQDYSREWNPLNTIMKVSKEIDKPYERSRVYESDLLITVVGANVGRMAIVTKELSGANISRSVARLSINTEQNDSLFYYYYLKGSIDKIIFENTVGGAQPVLNLKELDEIRVIQPNRTEQSIISNKVDKIEASIKNDITTLKKLQSLKTGLMQDLLSGKVRVNMDNKN